MDKLSYLLIVFTIMFSVTGVYLLSKDTRSYTSELISNILGVIFLFTALVLLIVAITDIHAWMYASTTSEFINSRCGTNFSADDLLYAKEYVEQSREFISCSL